MPPGGIYKPFSGSWEVEFHYLAEIYQVGVNFIAEFGLNEFVLLDIKKTLIYIG